MYAVVDMGSNTMRLSIYHLDNGQFQLFLHKKKMVGLAGYVKNGCLSEEGINMAIQGLKEFDVIIKNLDIEKVMVFATASLRNVDNTKEAETRIEKETGYPIHVISGEEEAKLDFKGAVSRISIKDGILVDIGGGSTEVVSFFDRTILDAVSIPIGSLSLYKKQVKRILPKKEERAEMKEAIRDGLEHSGLTMIKPDSHQLIGVGGTIRAIGKLYRHFYERPEDDMVMETKKLKKLYRRLTSKKDADWQLILKLCPDRIHTLIPGFLMLTAIMDRYEIEAVVVSEFGLREGYLLKYQSASPEENTEKEVLEK